jgi:hypothetical protein
VSTRADRIHRFAGTPREVGKASGRALGPRLERNIAHYLDQRPSRPEALDLGALRHGALPWLRTLPERFQEELEGLAEGADVPLQRVAEWSYVESCLDDGCSALAGTMAGHAWIARNNDMVVPGIWGHATVREITGRIPTLTFGQEGDVFTATGINRDRLWLHHQALSVRDAPRRGRPHLSGWVLLTDMLETCATIDDVEARLVAIDRDEGMLLFAVDGASDEVAIFECGCSRHVRRSTAGPFLAGANHACVLDEPPPAGDSRSRQARLETLARGLYAHHPGANLPRELIAMLADDAVERRGPRIWTVYATAACPATGVVWFSFGAYPAASRGEWAAVEWPW